MRKAVGSMVLLALVIYLFVKGALVMRPRETVAALSALIAALAQACSGSVSADAGSTSPKNGAAFEERRERDLVRDRQGHEGREGDVDASVFDHAQVLGVKPGEFGGSLLRQFPLFTKLPKLETETALGTFDGLLQGGTKPHL